MELPEGLQIVLVEAETGRGRPRPRRDRLQRSRSVRRRLGAARLHARRAGPVRGGAPRGRRRLPRAASRASAETTERPLLNHLAVLVDSADEWRQTAEDSGHEIAEVKDAANTYAVFVWGPERVKLEYVEHKPSFSLV